MIGLAGGTLKLNLNKFNKQCKSLIYHHRLWWRFSEVYPTCLLLTVPPYYFNNSFSLLLMPIVSILQKHYTFTIVNEQDHGSSWRYTKIEHTQ